MPKCPLCGKDIYILRYCEKAINIASFDGIDYRNWDTVYTEKAWYECSECGEKLFYKESDAKAFILLGIIKKHNIPKIVKRKIEITK